MSLIDAKRQTSVISISKHSIRNWGVDSHSLRPCSAIGRKQPLESALSALTYWYVWRTVSRNNPALHYIHSLITIDEIEAYDKFRWRDCKSHLWNKTYTGHSSQNYRIYMASYIKTQNFHSFFIWKHLIVHVIISISENLIFVFK